MYIHNELLVGQIRTTFHQHYPGLQIRFYSKAHKDHEGSMAEFELDDSVPLSEIVPKLVPGSVNLSTVDLTVEDLEQEFEQRFGLHMQVFRRSADLWLQTIATDSWTLQKQNRKGLSSVEASGAKEKYS